MSNAKLMIGSYVDDAQRVATLAGLGTITPIKTDSASDLTSTMPITNLARSLPSLKWRSYGTYTAGATYRIRLDTGGVNNRTVNAFSFYNHNLSLVGEYRLKGYSSEAERDADTAGSGTATYYDSGWLSAGTSPSIGYGTGAYATYGYGGYPLEDWQRYPFIALYLSSSIVTRWWAVFLKDSGNITGYLEAGRLLLSKYFEPSVNFEWGYSLTWQDPSRQIRTRGGALRSEYRTPYRQVEVAFSWLDDYDLDFILEIERLIGKRNEILWSAYPNEDTLQGRRNILLGRLSDWTPVGKQRQGYSYKMTIEESI